MVIPLESASPEGYPGRMRRLQSAALALGSLAGCGAQPPVDPEADEPYVEQPVASDLPWAAPADGCRVDGQVVAHGTKYRASDGCNTCECTPTGPMCTKILCPDAPPRVGFAFGSAVPGPEAMMTLGDAAATAMRSTGLVIVVGRATGDEWRTDGETAKRRAISVAARLRSLGVPKDRLRVTTDREDRAEAFIRFDQ